MEDSVAAKPSDEIWAKLVPSDLRYSNVEITSDEKVICSEISATLSDKHSWCKIVRNSDMCSATIENKSPTTILVDGAEVCNANTIVIKDGSEIFPGPDKEGFVSYRFHIMSSPETCQRQLKICVDVENAKCSICLNIWHDVVTVSPCLHNFCNGCFSEWLRRLQKKRSAVCCPECRAVVHFVNRNPFLRTIVEDMIRADSSLRRSDEEIALLDTHASISSNIAEGVVARAGLVHIDQAGGSVGDEEEESNSEDHDHDEETDSEDQSDEETNSSLRRSDEEIVLSDTHSPVLSVSDLAEGVVAGAGPVHTDQGSGSGGDEEEEETDSEDQSDEEDTDSSLRRSDEEIVLSDTHPPISMADLMPILAKMLLWLKDVHMNQQVMWTRTGGPPDGFIPFRPFDEFEKRILEWAQQPQSSGAAAGEGDAPTNHMQEDVA